MNPFINDKNCVHDWTLERKLIIVRIIASFVSLIFINLATSYLNNYLCNLTTLLYLLYNMSLWLYIPRKYDHRIFVISVFIDVIIISLLIYASGGIHSDLYILYFVVLSYTLAKKHKHLITSISIVILLSYLISCVIFAALHNLDYSTIIVKLLIRISIMSMAVFILHNIKAEMNHESKLSQKTYEMAIIDPLTQVYNRNMLDILEKHRSLNPYSVTFAMIDIDDFKCINDSFGHQKGDKILSYLGALINKNIRFDDICIRYGGEEFLLAFNNTDSGTALKILDRIRSNFGNHVFYYDNQPINCSISVGLAYGAADIEGSTIISHADQALYKAKRSGKNSIMVYAPAT